MSEKFAENVSRSAENIEKLSEVFGAAHISEANEQAAETVKWLQEQWSARGFSPEQCVFALALTTINFRETVPEKYGGKEMFDRVAHAAHNYYHAG